MVFDCPERTKQGRVDHRQADDRVAADVDREPPTLKGQVRVQGGQHSVHHAHTGGDSAKDCISRVQAPGMLWLGGNSMASQGLEGCDLNEAGKRIPEKCSTYEAVEWTSNC